MRKGSQLKAALRPSQSSPVQPKALSEQVNKGLEYLVNQQQPDGGWGQGGGWRSSHQGGRVEGANVQDPADVADTCMAALSLIRAGNTPERREILQEPRPGRRVHL